MPVAFRINLKAVCDPVPFEPVWNDASAEQKAMKLDAWFSFQYFRNNICAETVCYY